MVVQPRLVGNLIPGRSNWKAIGQTDIFVLQHHPRQATRSYRIITRGFPHYRVAEGDVVDKLQEELTTLSRRARGAIQGKITSKKISSWLKGGSVIMPPIATPGQDDDDDDDILDGDDEDEEEDDEDDPRLHLLLHEEEGYLSDLSTISNEGIIMAADDSTLRDNASRESASRRLMRRAISLEDLNTSAIHHNHSHHHMQCEDSPPERPSSSVSMSLPVPSDTLSSLQPNDQTLYHRYYHHRSLERPSNYNTLLSDDNTQYSLYRLDHDHHGPIRTMSPDADMDDLVLMDDAKSTYTTSPPLQDHPVEAGKDVPIAAAGSLGWLNASPLLEALVNWVEGPPNRPQPKRNPNEKPNPILEIPFQFIALLTYPVPDPKAGDKMSLAMVRETSFVRQRRKTLMMLTTYTLVVRYCSFDFFLVVLFASNCGMLFLMKNSGRMNVNMAKRAVGQRVGWAKQWAGGFFKRGNGGMTNHHYSNINGNDTMSIHQGITTSNASSSKSLSHISSAPAESIREINIAASIVGEKADSAQENNPQIKRRGLFGKRKTYTTSLAPSQGVAASSLSILSPTSATGDGDDVSVMTGRTKRGFFKRNTNSSTNRSATAPPTTTLDSPPTPTTAKHSNNSSTSTTATVTILTSKNGTPMLSTSPQPQSQSFSQLDLMMPARSPSPSVLRKEFSQNGSKSWGVSGSASSGAIVVATGTPPLPSGQSSGSATLPISSSASSGSPSPNSSPKSATAANPAAAPTTTTSNTNTNATTTTSMSTGRSLASAINPRSLLSSFTSQSQKQQQQASATSPVTPTFPHHPPSTITTSMQGISSSSTVPISPRPIKAAGPRTGFLTGSLSTTRLSSVLGGRGSTDLGNANGGGRSGTTGGGVYEEEERLDVTMEYQLQQHHQQLQFNPHRRASTTSNVGIKYSALSSGSSSSSSMVSPSSPSPQEAFFREHHLHPFAMSSSGQDHFQQQLQFQHQHQQQIHPMWQISSAGPHGTVVGDGTDRESSGRRSIGGGLSSNSGGGRMMVKEDLLDAVTSAAAEAMEGFDREA